MPNLETLRRNAHAAAEWRGHAILWSAPTHGEYRSMRAGECSRCGAHVSVTTRPLPNEIDIGGSAVAINCLSDHDTVAPTNYANPTG